MRRDLPAQTSIRGLAAVVVMIAHTQFGLLFPGSVGARYLYSAFRWNNEAVDLFFILSGFILFYVYGSRPPAWKRYALARFSRIYPLYIASILFFLTLAALQFLALGVSPEKLSWKSAIGNVLLIQSWPWPIPTLSLNYPTWSISVEWFLYIFLFPALYGLFRIRTFAGLGSSTRGRFVLGGAIVALMSVLWLLHREHEWMTVHQDFTRGFENAFERGLVGFTAGYLLAVFAEGLKFVQLVSAPTELFILVAFPLLMILHPPGTVAILLGLTPLLIYLAAVENSLATAVLAKRPLVYLGELSYSIYVWHAPVQGISSRLFHVRAVGTGEIQAGLTLSQTFGYLSLCLIGTLVVSHLSYFHFELPVKAALRKRFQG